MAKKKDDLKVGDKVSFFRTHDKTTQLTGTIAKIHPGEADLVDVDFDVDGKVVEVDHVETVHAADVTVTGKSAGKESKDPKKGAAARD